MRIAILIVAVALAVIFVGGAINIGRAPLFGHIDSALGTTALMNLHYTVFSMVYRGQGSAGAGYGKTKSDIDDMAKKAEFGKREKYKRLDRESTY
jgi:hypothetical protein